MKISLRFSAAQELDLGLGNCLELCRELGVDGVELTDDPARNDAQLQSLRNELDASSLDLACLQIGCDFGLSGAAAGSMIAGVEEAIERARRLGATRVLFVPRPPRAGASPERVRGELAAGLRACLESLPAGAPPATLGNSGGCAAIYGRCRALLKICAQVGPRLFLTYDVGNWLLVGEDPLETLDTVFERVVHVHLKDWVVLRASERPLRAGLLRLSRDLALRVRRHYAPPFLRSAAARVGLSERIGRAVPAANGDIYRSVPLGDGIVPLEALFCRLRAAGYLGYLSLEYEGAGDLGGAYRRGRAYLTERLPAS